MSLLQKRINNDILYRNNQTLQNNSLSYSNQLDYLPTISSSYKKSPLNILNNNNKLYLKKIKIKSPDLKHSLKNSLFNQKKIPNISQIKQTKKEYISKLIIENPPSPNDIKYVLQNYLKKNRSEIEYKSFYENNTVTFSFEDEKIALDFAKIFFHEKRTNPLYLNTKINLTLSEKEKLKKLKEQERKIEKEVLRRLFFGEGYEKKEKPKKKILGNINFGIESPFYNINRKRIKKNFSEIMKEEKNLFKQKFSEHKGDKFGYVGYDGQPLKNYQKLKISILDTSYKPPEFKLREENKSKWMSPLDFKIY